MYVTPVFFTISAQIGKCLYEMLTVQAFRPDRVLAAASRFVAIVMGETFQQEAEQELDLASIVNNEVCEEVM